MDPRGLVEEAVRKAGEALPTVLWGAAEHHVADGCVARQGNSPDGWHFVIGRSATGDDAQPFVYDGAASRGTLILRLTPALALRAWELATASEETPCPTTE